MTNILDDEYRDTLNVNHLNLIDLPTDVLLCILTYCDLSSLRNLSISCKRLNEVASEGYVWLKHSNGSVITNQLSNEVLERSLNKLEPKEKCRISLNWRHGFYRERVYNSKIKYMPWLHLEANVLWISQGRSILAVRRHNNGLRMQRPLCTINTAHTDDITQFVKVDDIIFSGGRDKQICGWSTRSNKMVLVHQSSHTQDIQGLDCKQDVLVSCSKDSTIKVWQVEEKSSSLECTQTLHVWDRVWCVAIDPLVCTLAAGSAGYNRVHPLHLYDLNRGMEKPLKKSVLKNGAAVYDIHWECPNTLITCGFDTVTRLWDARVGCCVGSWHDPFGAPGYCLATDQNYAVLCGTAHHGRAQLWDKRHVTSVQAYFARSSASSPVYSLSFDSSQLFIAQDSCINVLDFSGHSAPDMHRADYSSYWAATGSGRQLM